MSRETYEKDLKAALWARDKGKAEKVLKTVAAGSADPYEKITLLSKLIHWNDVDTSIISTESYLNFINNLAAQPEIRVEDVFPLLMSVQHTEDRYFYAPLIKLVDPKLMSSYPNLLRSLLRENLPAEDLLDLLTFPDGFQDFHMVYALKMEDFQNYIGLILKILERYSQTEFGRETKTNPMYKLNYLLKANYPSKDSDIKINLIQSIILQKNVKSLADCDLLKTLLQKGLVAEPRKKIVHLLGELTQHLPSIDNPSDLRLISLLRNNFTLLDICVQKEVITVTDCLEIAFFPSRNKDYQTILDFAVKNNAESLQEIFNFLEKIKKSKNFTIEPYIDQVMHLPTLSQSQKDHFYHLYKAQFIDSKIMSPDSLAEKLNPDSPLNKAEKTEMLWALAKNHLLSDAHKNVLTQYHKQVVRIRMKMITDSHFS